MTEEEREARRKESRIEEARKLMEDQVPDLSGDTIIPTMPPNPPPPSSKLYDIVVMGGRTMPRCQRRECVRAVVLEDCLPKAGQFFSIAVDDGYTCGVVEHVGWAVDTRGGDHTLVYVVALFKDPVTRVHEIVHTVGLSNRTKPHVICPNGTGDKHCEHNKPKIEDMFADADFEFED